MYTSVLHVISYVVIVISVTMNKKSGTKDIVNSKNQVELKPIIITCTLTDVIIISAPVVAARKPRYYLTNPHGEVTKLDISAPHYNYKATLDLDNFDTINVKFINKTKFITLTQNYKVFNVNFDQTQDTEDTFGQMESKMEANDFMIGPVTEDDCGNWEVSAIYKTEAGEWAEAYQVVTLDIIEVVPGRPLRPILRPGENFELSFAYPIPHLQTCQLVVPKSSFDRFYDRGHTKPDTCSYVVKNVSASDTGLWGIIGVGRIAYYATIQLTVKNIRRRKRRNKREEAQSMKMNNFLHGTWVEIPKKSPASYKTTICNAEDMDEMIMVMVACTTAAGPSSTEFNQLTKQIAELTLEIAALKKRVNGERVLFIVRRGKV